MNLDLTDKLSKSDDSKKNQLRSDAENKLVAANRDKALKKEIDYLKYELSKEKCKLTSGLLGLISLVPSLNMYC